MALNSFKTDCIVRVLHSSSSQQKQKLKIDTEELLMWVCVLITVQNKQKRTENLVVCVSVVTVLKPVGCVLSKCRFYSSGGRQR